MNNVVKRPWLACCAQVRRALDDVPESVRVAHPSLKCSLGHEKRFNPLARVQNARSTVYAEREIDCVFMDVRVPVCMKAERVAPAFKRP